MNAPTAESIGAALQAAIAHNDEVLRDSYRMSFEHANRQAAFWERAKPLPGAAQRAAYYHRRATEYARKLGVV